MAVEVRRAQLWCAVVCQSGIRQPIAKQVAGGKASNICRLMHHGVNFEPILRNLRLS